MKTIYLIEKIWINQLENAIDSARGYMPHGFVETQEQADSICEGSRIFTREDCWAISYDMKQYRYKEIINLK